MSNDIDREEDDPYYFSEQYIKIVKLESKHAYYVYLTSEQVFLQDVEGLGLDKKKFKIKVKEQLKKFRIGLLDLDGELFSFFYKYFYTQGIHELTSFIYKLYNLLILHVYLTEKYACYVKNDKLNKGLLATNLAMSIIEGSVLGRYNFDPYFGLTYKNKFDAVKDFNDIKNTFLQQQLLMLVVIYNRWNILPKVQYTKVGQKNIITSIIEGSSSLANDDLIENRKWNSSIINIIKNFDDIMQKCKSSLNIKDSIKLANISFTKDFIDDFNFDKLLESYNFNEGKLIDKIPEAEITDTVGRILDNLIQQYISSKNTWKHVINFTNFFPRKVAARKYTGIEFADGYIVHLFNNKKMFGIACCSTYIEQNHDTYLSHLKNKVDYKDLDYSTNTDHRINKAFHYYYRTYVF